MNKDSLDLVDKQGEYLKREMLENLLNLAELAKQLPNNFISSALTEGVKFENYIMRTAGQIIQDDRNNYPTDKSFVIDLIRVQKNHLEKSSDKAIAKFIMTLETDIQTIINNS